MAKLPIPFGNPNTYSGHSGIDYPQASGTVFKASGTGTVRNLGHNSRGGYYIWVKYDGYPAVGYHHMDSHRGCPSPGTRVYEGTQLGLVGNSGHSTGPHLHSEVEGYATTSGYWLFFDRNRVVGQGGGSGGGGVVPTPKPEPTPEPEPVPEEDTDMDILLQVAPSGVWYVVNYRRGTAVRQWNGFQLDRINEEIAWGDKTVRRLTGLQPESVIQGLTIING